MLLPLRVAKLVVQISLLQHFRQNFLAGIARIGLISRTLYQEKESDYKRIPLRNCSVFVECYFSFEVITICFSLTNSGRRSTLCVPFRSATIVKTGKTMFLPRFGGHRSKTFANQMTFYMVFLLVLPTKVHGSAFAIVKD